MKQFRLWVLLLVIALWLTPLTVLAYDEPDDVSLSDILVIEDVIDDGDCLVYVPYDITYGTNPDINVDEAYIFRLLDSTATTEYGANLAYPGYDNGYGSGIMSFYLETALDDSFTYVVRVQQNPVAYPTPNYWDFTIDSTNWASDNISAEDSLKAKIIDSATLLSTTFDTTLLSTSEAGTTVLSASGELYFIRAIPGLQTMCPAIFSVQLENPNYTKRSWSYTFAESLKTTYEDTFIEDFMTGYAGLFEMNTTAAMNIISFFAFVLLIVLSVWKFKATMMSSLIDGYALLLLLMLLGFADMVLVGVMGFLSSAAGGVVLFLNRG